MNKVSGDYLDKIVVGDCLSVLQTMPSELVDMCVTSPPYWGLRDYGVDGQIGLEKTPEEYVAKLVAVFREVKRVLKPGGTMWLNLGDSYNGSQQTGGVKSISGKGASQPHGGILKDAPGLKPKDLVGIPWMAAFALRADGWYLRSDIIWAKPNPMPESVTDRPTRSHEYIFLLTKNAKYYYDAEEIKEESKTKPHAPGYVTFDAARTRRDRVLGGEANDRLWGKNERSNKRDVWTVTSKPCKEAHFATFPPDLIEPCILAGCPKGGLVLDPFMGSGTTAMVAIKHQRHYLGIELNEKYAKEIADGRRTRNVQVNLL